MAVHDRLKIARDLLGMTQKSASKAFGVSHRTWQDYEAGINLPGSKVLLELARLGININWLLTGEGEIRLYQPSKEKAETGCFSYVEKLKKIRGNFSIHEFSKKVGIDEETMLDLESGNTTLTIHDLSSICFHCGISPLWLVEDIGPMMKYELDKRPVAFIEKRTLLEALHATNAIRNHRIESGQEFSDDKWIDMVVKQYESIFACDMDNIDDPS